MVSILCVAGTRPELIKMAPVMKALSCYDSDFLVHSGQHCNINVFKNIHGGTGLAENR
ncbi:MAG: hypothetical protein KIH10_17855 [Candidatus Freyarchaeota archaeon]|nr:hypothetical protein [Candidatus Jordarchaeia archaeon]MBS7281521.1 hypothetical protein [Candidatus Jordarchaeia archaeon]